MARTKKITETAEERILEKLTSYGGVDTNRFKDGLLVTEALYPKKERIKDIVEFLNVFHPGGRVHVRAISQEMPAGKNILQGFFDDVEKLAETVVELNSSKEKGWNIYFGINEISKSKLCENIMHTGKGVSKSQIDVVTTVCLDIDPCDEIRPARPETVHETIEAAIYINDAVSRKYSIPAGTIITSGNGSQIFWRCHVPIGGSLHEYADVEFGKKFVAYMAEYFLDKDNSNFTNLFNVKFDMSVGNAAQIMRLPGTINWKKGGDKKVSSHRVALDITRRAPRVIHSQTCDMIEYAYPAIMEKKENKRARSFDDSYEWSEDHIKNVDEYYDLKTRKLRAIDYIAEFDEKTYTPGADGDDSRGNYFWSRSSAIQNGFLLNKDDTIELMDKNWNQIKCHPPLDMKRMRAQANDRAAERYTQVPKGSLLGPPPENKFAFKKKMDKIYNEAAEKAEDEVIRAMADNDVAGYIYQYTKQNKTGSKRMSKSDAVKFPSELVMAPGGKDNMFNRIYDFYASTSKMDGVEAGVFSAALATISTLSAKYYVPPSFLSLMNTSHTGLFIANVTGPGVGKSLGMNAMRDMIHELGMGCFIGGNGFKSDAQLEENIASKPGCATAYVIEELGDRLGAAKGKKTGATADISSLVRDYYSTARTKKITVGVTSGQRVQGKGIEYSNKGTATMRRPCLIIFGNLTEDQILEIASTKSRDNGTTSRFLFFSDGLVIPKVPKNQRVNKWKHNYQDLIDGKIKVPKYEIPNDIVAFCEKLVNPAWKGSSVDVDEKLRELEHKKHQSLLASDEPQEKWEYLQDLKLDDSFLVRCIPTMEAMEELEEISDRCVDLVRRFQDLGHDQLAKDVVRMAENISRVASISAIGKDPVKPIVEIDDVIWASKVVSTSVQTMMRLAGIKPAGASTETFADKRYSEIVSSAKKEYLKLVKENDSLPDDSPEKREVVFLSRKDFSKVNKLPGMSDKHDPLLAVLQLAHENGDIYLVTGEEVDVFMTYYRKRHKMPQTGRRKEFICIPIIKDEQDRIIKTVGRMIVGKR